MTDIVDKFIDYVLSIIDDPVQVDRVIYQNPQLMATLNVLNEHAKLSDEPEPIPALEDVRAIEATLFKNKRKPPYAIQLKIYKNSNGTFMGKRPDWKANAELIHKDAIDDYLIKSLSRFDTSEKEDMHESFVLLAETCNFVGIFRIKGIGKGTTFYKKHLTGVDIDTTSGMIKQMILYTPNLSISLDGFVNTTSKGTPLEPTDSAALTLCQTRTSFDKSLNKNWTTKYITLKPVNEEEIDVQNQIC